MAPAAAKEVVKPDEDAGQEVDVVGDAHADSNPASQLASAASDWSAGFRHANSAAATPVRADSVTRFVDMSVPSAMPVPLLGALPIAETDSVLKPSALSADVRTEVWSLGLFALAPSLSVFRLCSFSRALFLCLNSPSRSAAAGSGCHPGRVAADAAWPGAAAAAHQGDHAEAGGGAGTATPARDADAAARRRAGRAPWAPADGRLSLI